MGRTEQGSRSPLTVEAPGHTASPALHTARQDFQRHTAGAMSCLRPGRHTDLEKGLFCASVDKDDTSLSGCPSGCGLPPVLCTRHRGLPQAPLGRACTHVVPTVMLWGRQAPSSVPTPCTLCTAARPRRPRGHVSRVASCREKVLPEAAGPAGPVRPVPSPHPGVGDARRGSHFTAVCSAPSPPGAVPTQPTAPTAPRGGLPACTMRWLRPRFS